MLASLKSFFNPQPETASNEKSSSLDIVMYTAALASNPQAINAISDQIREVTAGIDPQNPTITTEQEGKLKNIYLALEAYLVTNEPAQKFTKESLRERIMQKLHVENSKSTFWGEL